MAEQLFSSPVDVPGIGKVRPMSIRSLCEMNEAIRRKLVSDGVEGLDAESAAIVASRFTSFCAMEMTDVQRAQMVMQNPELLAVAVEKMVGDKNKSSDYFLGKLTRENMIQILPVVAESYGLSIGGNKEKEPPADPQTAADSNE